MGSERRSRMWGGLGILAAVLSIVGTGRGKVFYVDANGPADFNNIQAAIDDSNVVDGDTILVHPGRYVENINFLGKNITLKSTNPSDPEAVARTIIDGNRLGHTVIFSGSETSSCLLSGFTITGGQTSSYGGGVNALGSYATISFCNITDNIGRVGGGIRFANGLITNCLITNNYASHSGGGLGFCENSIVSNCVISYNTANKIGGGMAFSDYNTISNCLISHNSAGSGGGLSSLRYSRIASCTIVNNTSTSEAGGVRLCVGSSIWNSVVWGNSPYQVDTYIGSAYCNIQGGVSGVGNIEAEPVFVDPDTDNYHLSSDSPCIDAGYNTWPELLPLKDLEGNYRQIDGDNDGIVNVDMGAYEYGTVETPLISAQPDQFEFIVVANDPNSHSQVISIWNIGLDALNWQIVEQCPWLDVSANTGHSTGEIDDVTLAAHIVTSTTPGRYTYDLVISDTTASNSPVVVPITLIVYDQGRLCVPSEFVTIQDAVDVAGNGDIITVEDGIYKGAGNRDIDCLGKQLIIRSANGPAFTIIDCENSDYGFYVDSGDRLEGFTILNAFEGGIGASGSFTIERCIISDGSGSGIVCSGEGNQFIANCLIHGNASYGIRWISRGQPNIANITNCTIAKNLTGGIYSVGAGRSGPFSLRSSVTNSILWQNLGQQIIEYVENDVTVTYSNIEDNWPGEGNIDLTPLFADPNKNDYHLKSQGGRYDPNIQSWVYDEVTSPCIDAGNPQSPIGAEPFPNGGVANMGAYGATEEASKSYFGKPPCEIILAGDVNGDCVVDFLDFRLMALHWCEDNNP